MSELGAQYQRKGASGSKTAAANQSAKGRTRRAREPDFRVVAKMDDDAPQYVPRQLQVTFKTTAQHDIACHWRSPAELRPATPKSRSADRRACWPTWCRLVQSPRASCDVSIAWLGDAAPFGAYAWVADPGVITGFDPGASICSPASRLSMDSHHMRDGCGAVDVKVPHPWATPLDLGWHQYVDGDRGYQALLADSPLLISRFTSRRLTFQRLLRDRAK